MAKECTISTGKLPLGGLTRISVVGITDHPVSVDTHVNQQIKQTFITKKQCCLRMFVKVLNSCIGQVSVFLCKFTCVFLYFQHEMFLN